MNITSKEIAELCGVSRGTVDRALNNRPGVNEETKQKIMETAERLGYRPHFLAQSLVKGKTMSIGVVVFDLHNRLFPQLIHVIESRAREMGYFLYLTMTNKDPAIENDCMRHLADRKVDAMILMSVQQGEAVTELISKLSIPFVTIGNFVSPSVPYVWMDDRKSGHDAAAYLLEKGYEEIWYVSPPLAQRGRMNVYSVEERYSGFQEALANSPAKAVVLDDNRYLENIDKLLDANGIGAKRGKSVKEKDKDKADKKAKKKRKKAAASYDAILAASPRKSMAILCSSDVYALEILSHLRSKGIRVPEDVGLMGIDNIDTLKLVSPALTTLAIPVDEIGQAVVDCLLQGLSGIPMPPRTLLDHRIVPGETC